jgi:hypothetical protein
MRSVTGLICACYSLLLILYPRALRDAYGREMVGVMREQILDGGEGWAVLRAFAEVVTIGIPARLRNDVSAAAPLAVCTSTAVFYGLLFVLHDTGPLDAFMRRWLGVQCP